MSTNPKHQEFSERYDQHQYEYGAFVLPSIMSGTTATEQRPQYDHSGGNNHFLRVSLAPHSHRVGKQGKGS